MVAETETPAEEGEKMPLTCLNNSTTRPDLELGEELETEKANTTDKSEKISSLAPSHHSTNMVGDEALEATHVKYMETVKNNTPEGMDEENKPDPGANQELLNI